MNEESARPPHDPESVADTAQDHRNDDAVRVTAQSTGRTTATLGLDPLLAIELETSMPTALGRFRIIRELGRGGMGVVYEAEQDLPWRRVALKTLCAPSAKALAQFRIEVNATARVVHPGIPQVFEVFEVAGLPVLVMECVVGHHLDEAVRELSRHERVRVLRDVALAVHAVHEHGVIHRDLKPSNVLLSKDGQVKVLDFGIAALSGQELRGSFTINYAAPEQLRGSFSDVRCDVYGLGALAHEVLTGRLPFSLTGLTFAEVLEHKNQPPAPPTELPSSLASIVVKALEPRTEDRYPSALALAQDLDRYLDWRPVQAFEGERFARTAARFVVSSQRVPPPRAGLGFVVRDVVDDKVVATIRARPLDATLIEAGGVRWFDVTVPPALALASLILDEFDDDEHTRGTRSAGALFEAVVEHGLRSGVLVLLMACPVARYLEHLRLGFRTVGRVVRIADSGHVVPMVLINHDLEHFVRMESPLAAVLRTHGRFDDLRGVEWMAALLETGHASPTPLFPVGSDPLEAPLLRGMSEQGKRELMAGAERRLGGPGDALITEGETGKWMALVESGLVEIVVRDEVVAIRVQGELIGEMSFLLDAPRTARVVVAAPGTTLVIISPEAISALSRASDREQLWRNLATALARKLEVQSQRSSRRAG